jgi:hypothetical protein
VYVLKKFQTGLKTEESLTEFESNHVIYTNLDLQMSQSKKGTCQTRPRLSIPHNMDDHAMMHGGILSEEDLARLSPDQLER